jgi:hypothetical protein
MDRKYRALILALTESHRPDPRGEWLCKPSTKRVFLCEETHNLIYDDYYSHECMECHKTYKACDNCMRNKLKDEVIIQCEPCCESYIICADCFHEKCTKLGKSKEDVYACAMCRCTACPKCLMNANCSKCHTIVRCCEDNRFCLPDQTPRCSACRTPPKKQYLSFFRLAIHMR